MSTLEQQNCRWRDYIESPGAVALLGLAPMSDEEATEVKKTVHEFTHRRPESLVRCLQLYPAVTATWLAVSAANSYHDGTFWPRLATELGFPGNLASQAQRQALTAAFSKACRELDRPRWQSQRHGGSTLVGEFLFHAGFPVCHSRHLAKAMWALDRDGELLDPTEPDADERLSERLTGRLENLPIPSMLRALRGGAGPLVARATMEVLSTGGYERLNPRFGQALKEAFNARTVSFSGPRLHPPFLRLDVNVTGFEIVCPPQDAAFVSSGRFGWLVNSRLHAWPSAEYFVYSTGQEESIEVAASGLCQANPFGRSWRLSEFLQPTASLHVFDAESRRFRISLPLSEETAEITSGDYWLLFPPGWNCSDANLEFPWPDAVALHVTIQPGGKKVFEGPDGKQFQLASRMAPMLLPETLAVALAHDGEKLLLGDLLRLQVWLPQDSPEWNVKLMGGGIESNFSCQPKRTEGDWSTAAVDASPFTKQLAPALHDIEAVLLKNGQIKARCRFLLWIGCLDFHPNGSFEWPTRPRNLDTAMCSGFEETAEGLKVRPGFAPFRTLAFKFNGTVRHFRWRNAGTFAELVRRRIGHMAAAHSLAFGTTLAASADSDAWLRVWFDLNVTPVFFVNGVPEIRQISPSGFIEYSVADLAVRYQEGGRIELELDGRRVTVAHFARPLRSISLDKPKPPPKGCRSLDFILSQHAEAVRPFCVELISGRQIGFEPKSIDSREPTRFESRELGLPAILVRVGRNQDGQPLCTTSLGMMLEAALKVKTQGSTAIPHEIRLGLDIPINGWPPGFWIIGLEAARRAAEGCETLSGPDGKPAVVLIATEPPNDSAEIHQLLWKAWQETLHHSQQPWLNWNWCGESLGTATVLLETLQGFIPNGVSDRLTSDFAWVKLIERAVAAEAERRVRSGDASAVKVLLSLARSQAGRLRLLRIPEVLAFPPKAYVELKHTEPAFTALRHCADLYALDWLSEFTAEWPETLSHDYLRCFANYGEIAEHGATTELEKFSLEGYWQALNQGPASGVFDLNDSRDLLGSMHWQWTLREFRRRYATLQVSEAMGFANACAHHANQLLAFVRANTERAHLVPEATWVSPCPILHVANDFEEALPRFCSVFALAARAAGEKRLSFPDAVAALRGGLPEQSFSDGLRALLELAPELLGFFLLFWQTLIKTSPHNA